MTKRTKNHAIELKFKKNTLDLKMTGPRERNSRLPIVTSIFSVGGYACFVKNFAAYSAIILVFAFLYRYTCNVSNLSLSADTSIILLQVVIRLKYIPGLLVRLPFQWSSKGLALCIFIFQVMITFLGTGSKKKGEVPAINLKNDTAGNFISAK